MCEVINIVDENDELIASISDEYIILKRGYKVTLTSEDESVSYPTDEKSE